MSFTTNTKKGFAKMQSDLREWGAAGYELVSVTPNDLNADSVMVFMQREIVDGSTASDEAAQ